MSSLSTMMLPYDAVRAVQINHKEALLLTTCWYLQSIYCDFSRFSKQQYKGTSGYLEPDQMVFISDQSWQKDFGPCQTTPASSLSIMAITSPANVPKDANGNALPVTQHDSIQLCTGYLQSFATSQQYLTPANAVAQAASDGGRWVVALAEKQPIDALALLEHTFLHEFTHCVMGGLAKDLTPKGILPKLRNFSPYGWTNAIRLQNSENAGTYWF